MANEAIIETIARAIWEGREKTFPEKVRMTWESGTDAARRSTLAHAAASVAALESQGYAIVPVEPSEAMISAGIVERHEQSVPEAWALATANIFRAMIAANSLEAKA